MTPTLRCAIYTRKSSEEGLEQNFNSLHAQREACEAYVLSQAGEGWTCIKTLYDDGGFSGGSMGRPALKQLLADIEARRIDIVVVYKVDRLTRSLADFAKIVEIFDARGVSFVSVTQAFNTTSSMGRLTLNVLLSFAQFEREVTGERIRDKIAASKAKGLRMGGRPPLGYDVVDLRLVINEPEAQIVRGMFSRYLELGSVGHLADELEAGAIQSKAWTMRSGETVGGRPIKPGALYYLLSNPIYRGCNRHKEKLYENSHPPIIDDQTWAAVQHRLADTNASKPASPLRTDRPLLRGLVFDDRGHPMINVHTTRDSRRYRYYLSQPKSEGKDRPLGSLHRIAAGVLETAVVDLIQPRLSPSWKPELETRLRCRDAIVRLTLGADQITIVLIAGAAGHHADASSATDGMIEFCLPIILKRREGAAIILLASRSEPAPRVDKTLVRAITLARSWAAEIAADRFASVKELARHHGLCSSHTMRLLPLAYLAPDLVAMIIEGRQPVTLTLKALTSRPLPMHWSDQRQLIDMIGLGLLLN
jgi:site-specific DNA recombinase